MSTEKKKSGPLAQIAAGLVILAAITGYYLYEAAGRKAGPAETAPVAVQSGLSKDLSKGALAAFLIHPEPKPLPDLHAVFFLNFLFVFLLQHARCISRTMPPRGFRMSTRRCRQGH